MDELGRCTFHALLPSSCSAATDAVLLTLQLMKRMRAIKKLPVTDPMKNQTRKEVNRQAQLLLGDLNYQKCMNAAFESGIVR